MTGFVIYRNPANIKHSWIRYMLGRIDKNQNNLICLYGKTGSGKTYSALAICELMSAENGVPFTIDNVVFTLKELMTLINSGKLKKGSCIVFDEPQVTISAREFQSKANKVFNYLLTTFRHQNLTLFFCTPYADLLDKTARKLFHGKFETISIDREKMIVRLNPKVTEYNSELGKFYNKYLQVFFIPEGKHKFTNVKLKYWDVPKPSDDLIKVYEEKKSNFTKKLNKAIERELDAFEKKKKEEMGITDEEEIVPAPKMSDTDKEVLVTLQQNPADASRKSLAEKLGIKRDTLNKRLERFNSRYSSLGISYSNFAKGNSPNLANGNITK